MYEKAQERIKEVSEKLGINLTKDQIFHNAIMLSEVDNYDGDLSDERVRNTIDFTKVEDDNEW